MPTRPPARRQPGKGQTGKHKRISLSLAAPDGFGMLTIPCARRVRKFDQPIHNDTNHLGIFDVEPSTAEHGPGRVGGPGYVIDSRVFLIILCPSAVRTVATILGDTQPVTVRECAGFWTSGSKGMR